MFVPVAARWLGMPSDSVVDLMPGKQENIKIKWRSGFRTLDRAPFLFLFALPVAVAARLIFTAQTAASTFLGPGK
jgi:hypothetical protein